MIDSILSLALSIHTNKGVYALLLGSGVSRSAGIPTGWEVVLDLIRKLALLKGQDCEPDPAAWFKDTFGEEPDYAKLLDDIAKSPSERQQLLRNYFEPSEAEKEQGLKAPMACHKAIAELVASGFVRVVVTTNFDRLLEKAMESIGIIPTVISTPDAVDGALPLTHTGCLIVKANGDYLDSRIRNTPNELSKYDKRLNSLLDRIFDEFGLIICGWSAEWDVALRAALERCKSYRFTTFWTVREEPQGIAKRLIDLRRAEVIKIRDADSFFQELAEKVSALQDIAKPHPLSAKVAVASLKKYLSEDRYRIPLHDLIMGETEKLFKELSGDLFPVQGVPFSVDEFLNRVTRFETLAETLLSLMINGCYWGEEIHQKLWTQCLERIANLHKDRSGLIVWVNLRLYPALLLFYGGGIASIAAERYNTLAALLIKAKNIERHDRERPLVQTLYTWAVMDEGVGQQLPGMDRHYTPLSDHLFKIFRETFRSFLPDDILYQKCFDRFEYLLALVHADLELKQGHSVWGPVGCFWWRHEREPNRNIKKEIEIEATREGEDWPPLKAGLFDGSIERFQATKKAFDETIAKASRW